MNLDALTALLKDQTAGPDDDSLTSDQEWTIKASPMFTHVAAVTKLDYASVDEAWAAAKALCRQIEEHSGGQLVYRNLVGVDGNSDDDSDAATVARWRGFVDLKILPKPAGEDPPAADIG